MPSPRPRGRQHDIASRTCSDPATCWSTRVEAGLLLHTAGEGRSVNAQGYQRDGIRRNRHNFPARSATFTIAPEPLACEGEPSPAEWESAQPEGEAVDPGPQLAVGGEPLPHPGGDAAHLLGREAGPQVEHDAEHALAARVALLELVVP